MIHGDIVVREGLPVPDDSAISYTPGPIVGGFTDIAAILSYVSGKQIDRRQVYTWSKRRNHNGFPDFVYDQDGHRQISVKDALAWYRHYTPSKGGRPRKGGNDAR